jgi:hypothetical protein
MRRIYQWLTERASFFRYDAAGPGTSSTVRTEVTVRREGMTVLVSGREADIDLCSDMRSDICPDICPLCGNLLAPAQAEQARLRLSKRAIPHETGPVDVDSEPP